VEGYFGQVPPLLLAPSLLVKPTVLVVTESVLVAYFGNHLPTGVKIVRRLNDNEAVSVGGTLTESDVELHDNRLTTHPRLHRMTTTAPMAPPPNPTTKAILATPNFRLALTIAEIPLQSQKTTAMKMTAAIPTMMFSIMSLYSYRDRNLYPLPAHMMKATDGASVASFNKPFWNLTVTHHRLSRPLRPLHGKVDLLAGTGPENFVSIYHLTNQSIKRSKRCQRMQEKT
jgi:hypothetical protein